MSKKRINPHVSALVPVDARQQSVADVLSILEAKRATLLADIEASEKGPRGGGSPRGFQTKGSTREQTLVRGLAWVQGRVDADFQLPVLCWSHRDLLRLGVAGLPAWTSEPQDEITALDLLTKMILACPAAMAPKPPAPATFPTPRGAVWEDVSLVVGELRLRVEVLGKRKQLTFRQAGFEDRRRGDVPDRLWNLLKLLATHGGVLPWPRSSSPERQGANLKQNMSQLGQRLNALLLIGLHFARFPPT